MKVKILKITLIPVCVIAFLITFILFGSMPQKSGVKKVNALSASVKIIRDKYGVVKIKGKTRTDVAYAMGFVHAQERFFQMDLLRRKGAGELSELFGQYTLEFDKFLRMHRFRNQAKIVMDTMTIEEKEILFSYAKGVNKGLSSLKCKPIEYLLLRAKPELWTAEDSLLVGYALFFALQDSGGDYPRTRGAIQKVLPEKLFSFLVDNGSEWSCIPEGQKTPFQKLDKADFIAKEQKELTEFEVDAEVNKGSNQWAVGPELTKDGSCILACDMHLDLAVPNTWFRMSLDYLSSNEESVFVSGVTLPGIPLIIIGSNLNLAWGFTASYIDTTDLIVLEEDKENKNLYLSSTGYKPFIEHLEKIKVKGESCVHQKYLWTEWGPVSPNLFEGKKTAIKWVAHENDAFNLKLNLLERARSVDEALELSSQINIPVLNFMAVDSKGNLAWTYMGKIPNRRGYAPGLPISYSEGDKSWSGVGSYSGNLYIKNPPEKFLCTANNKVVNREFLGKNYMNGIRAFQIKKNLELTSEHDLSSMKNIQLDESAFFFKRWQKLLAGCLSSKSDVELRLLKEVNEWNELCSSESKGYYWVREFRKLFSRTVIEMFISDANTITSNLKWHLLDMEEPIYLIAKQAVFDSKDRSEKDFSDFIQILEKTKLQLLKQYESSSIENWGQKNIFSIQHPLSDALGPLTGLFDMPKTSTGGDAYCPKVCRPKVGASVRMITIPNKRDQCLISMPCGQSGHFLSRHYRDHHKPWLEGKYFKLDCEEPVATLTLIPKSIK